EDHSDASAQLNHVDFRRVDIGTLNLDRPCCDPRVIDQVVHPVKAPKESRFAAPGGTDKRGYPLFRNLQIDSVKGLSLAVMKIDAVNFDQVPCQSGGWDTR